MTVHKEPRDTSASLQVRHTWVSAIKFPSLSSKPQKSGTRERISGGIRLIGAILFL